MCGKEFVGKGFVVRSLWGKDSCDVNFLNGWVESTGHNFFVCVSFGSLFISAELRLSVI